MLSLHIIFKVLLFLRTINIYILKLIKISYKVKCISFQICLSQGKKQTRHSNQENETSNKKFIKFHIQNYCNLPKEGNEKWEHGLEFRKAFFEFLYLGV